MCSFSRSTVKQQEPTSSAVCIRALTFCSRFGMMVSLVPVFEPKVPRPIKLEALVEFASSRADDPSREWHGLHQ